MLEPDNLPEHPAEIHFQIGQKAADRLGRLVEGNGLKAEQVRLARHETLVHQIPGAVTVELKPDIVKGQLKGKRPFGLVLGSAGDVAVQGATLAAESTASAGVQQEILQHIGKDAAGGWGLKAFRLNLAATRKQFSVVEDCTKCKGEGKYACNVCNHTGAVGCGTCGAQGLSPCPGCNGSGMAQQADGSSAPCQRCNGGGKITCPTCQGARQLRCNACKGHGSVGCTECDQSGSWTNTYEVTLHAEGSFDLDRQHLPADVIAVIDKLGLRAIAAENHAEIFHLVPVAEGSKLIVPYLAFLPLANVELSVEGRAYPAAIAGLNGQVLSIEPLLDGTIKPGINALFKLSKGPLAAEALVNQACRFRLIREALAGLSRQSKRGVYQKLVKDYPLILSDKYAKATVKYASMALLALSKGPRLKGMIGGSLLGAALVAGYYLGLRAAMAGALKPAIANGLDLGVLVLAAIAGWLSVKITAARALKRMLPEGVAGSAGRGLPPAGQEGLMAMAIIALAWLAAAFFAAPHPAWVEMFLRSIHK